jgi:hypothetical protein
MQNLQTTTQSGAILSIKDISLNEESEEFLVDYDIEGEATDDDIQETLSKWFNDTLEHIIKEATTTD